MSNSKDRTDENIKFVVGQGKGNQSAICGGVAPMKTINPERKTDSSQTKQTSGSKK